MIAVYSSSSDHIPKKYFAAASELGRQMAERGHGLVFGGGNVGLMNICARELLAAGGQVVGVIPKELKDLDLALEGCTEMIVTDGMRDRKATMETRADGFIALPGGFGTIEELLEIITLKQLRYHAKPIVILNVAGYFDPLLAQFDRMFSERFAKRKFAELYFVTAEPGAGLDYLERFRPEA
jgi:hypothetical protein